MEIRPGVITAETAAILNDMLRRLDELDHFSGAAPVNVVRDSSGVVVTLDEGASLNLTILTDVTCNPNGTLTKTYMCVTLPAGATVTTGACS